MWEATLFIEFGVYVAEKIELTLHLILQFCVSVLGFKLGSIHELIFYTLAE